MRTPRSVDLEITGRCNLRCKYCSHFTSGGDVEEDLPTGEWLKFFQELRDCSVMEVCLLGGEPFIREDFKELIEGDCPEPDAVLRSDQRHADHR